MDRIHEILNQKESINLEFKEAKRDVPKDLYESADGDFKVKSPEQIAELSNRKETKRTCS